MTARLALEVRALSCWMFAWMEAATVWPDWLPVWALEVRMTAETRALLL